MPWFIESRLLLFCGRLKGACVINIKCIYIMSQEEEIFPFEKIPGYLVKLRKDIRELRELVEKQFRLHPLPDEWMDIDELRAYPRIIRPGKLSMIGLLMDVSPIISIVIASGSGGPK